MTSWQNRLPVSIPVACFLLAVAIRLVVVPITIQTSMNPYALADAVRFARSAAFIAEGVSSGIIFEEGISYVAAEEPSSTYRRWSGILFFAWLIPGPSLWYATIFVALLGSGSIYNVARLGEYLHSQKAGALAAVPMIFYPSYVAIHTVLLREAAILFGITTTALLLLKTIRNRPVIAIVGASISMALVTLLRPENGILLGGMIIGGAVMYVLPIRKSVLAGVGLIGILGIVASIPHIQPVRDWYLRTRADRFEGRTTYLGSIPFETSADVLFSGLLAAVYFLFTPFPWMIETPADLLIAVESAISIAFFIFALYGIVIAFRRFPVAVSVLVLGVVLGTILYGLGTVNVGTATRHRQSFLWVIFLLGSIGVVDLVAGFRGRASSRTTRRLMR